MVEDIRPQNSDDDREDVRRPKPRLYRRPVFWGLTLLILGVLAGSAGFLVFLGFYIGERQLFPHTFLGRVEAKLGRTVLPRRPPPPVQLETLNTHLLLVDADVGSIDIGDPDNADPVSENGGGLTSFGGDVLLLAYDGRVYAATSGDDVHPTNVVAPDNNRAAYEAAAEDPAFADFDIRKGYLRYNDIAAYEIPDGQGLLASYTEYHPDRQCSTNTVAKLEFATGVASIDDVSADGDDWQVIYRSTPCLPFKSEYFALEGHMAGGKLAVTTQSSVLMTSGDYHLDGMRSEPSLRIAQDPTAEYGKTIAIDLVTGDHRIVSMGHRNPQGIAMLPDGTAIVAEHGPRGGDELNIIREGGNYGWPLESFGITYYGGTQIPGSLSFGRHDTFEPPIYSWVPSVATSSVAVVEGFHPAWDGDILVGALIDRSLHRLRLRDDRVVYSERIEIGSRVRALHQHSDGRLVLWTDNQEIIFLTGRQRQNMQELFDRFVDKSNISSRLAGRLETVVAVCAECHSFEVGDHQKAPGLARIYGDPIAGTSFDGYSAALASHGGVWTKENLAAFVRDPQAFAPGTIMPATGLEDDDLIETLVQFLGETDTAF